MVTLKYVHHNVRNGAAVVQSIETRTFVHEVSGSEIGFGENLFTSLLHTGLDLTLNCRASCDTYAPLTLYMEQKCNASIGNQTTYKKLSLFVDSKCTYYSE